MLLESSHELRITFDELVLLLGGRLLCELSDSATRVQLELVCAEAKHGLNLVDHLVGESLRVSRLGSLRELGEERMGDGERVETIAVLGLLEGEGALQEEMVGGSLSSLSLGDARCEGGGEGSEMGRVNDGAGEALGEVVLGGGGGGRVAEG